MDYLSLRQILCVCQVGSEMENYEFLLMDMAYLLLGKMYTLRKKKSAICGLVIGEEIHWRKQILCRENENH